MKLLFLVISTFLWGHTSQTIVFPIGNTPFWECEPKTPFDELLITWQGQRPQKGHCTFQVSLRQGNRWSDWLFYAEWGASGQILFNDAHSFAVAEFGKARPLQGFCDAFRIRAVPSGGAQCNDLHAFVASLSNLSQQNPETEALEGNAILLHPFPARTQTETPLWRTWDLSLPAAMSASLTFLNCNISTVEFAQSVCDDDNGFYESWILNSAEASRRLTTTVKIARLNSFKEIYDELNQNRPVIIGMKGYIPGGPRSYQIEHSLCVIGYDPQTRKVHCMDPGFPTRKSTFVTYDLADFMTAWKKRNCIAALF